MEGLIPKGWRRPVIVSLSKGRGVGVFVGIIEELVYRFVVKICVGILAERVRQVTEKLMGEEQKL